MDTKMMSGMMTMPGMGDTMVDADAMQACLEACMACEQAATMCAEMDSGEGMARCRGLCMNCADMSHATMRMMMRPMAMDESAMTSMLHAMQTMALACADECMKHVDMSEAMRMCAQACRDCASECEAMAARFAPMGSA
ncbi:hypothetical protein [Microbacterium karelineae]|uniref:hypothetical protein n=1 Tax=Microbacterium karelineae TaxID=2654283 RepID=UPI0012E9A61B|nr:hypothetical protein [Microbacterium karelineae]